MRKEKSQFSYLFLVKSISHTDLARMKAELLFCARCRLSNNDNTFNTSNNCIFANKKIPVVSELMVTSSITSLLAYLLQLYFIY